MTPNRVKVNCKEFRKQTAISWLHLTWNQPQNPVKILSILRRELAALQLIAAFEKQPQNQVFETSFSLAKIIFTVFSFLSGLFFFSFVSFSSFLSFAFTFLPSIAYFCCQCVLASLSFSFLAYPLLPSSLEAHSPAPAYAVFYVRVSNIAPSVI